jgi:predicted nucleotidyltransferase
MRLTPHEHQVIKQSASACFGEQAEVRLFGSRADDARRGGDIDLLIDTPLTDLAVIAQAHVRFVAKLYAQLGEQKIDVLIDYPHRQIDLPIYGIARQQGVVL